MGTTDKVTILIEGKDQASGAFNKAGGAIGKMAGIAAGIGVAGIGAAAAGLGFLTVKAIQAGADVQEMRGKFDTVFGAFGDFAANELADLGAAIGRNKFDLMGYASTFQDTFVPLGFAREEAAKMAINVTALSEDLASFNNLRTEDVVRDLQSALVGNTETLRKYGVVANEASIKQFALDQGLWDGTGAMDAQTKAAAILGLTMAGTSDAQGDAERTAGSWTNQMRSLKASLAETVAELGLKLLPIFTPLLSLAGKLAGVLGDKLAGALEAMGPVMDIVAKAMSALTSGDIHGGLQLLQLALGKFLDKIGLSDGAKTIIMSMAGAFRRLVDNLQDGKGILDSIKLALASFILGITGSKEEAGAFILKFDEMKQKIMDIMDPILTFIDNNVQLNDILLALGIVLASIIIPALVSAALSIGAILLPIVAVIAIVALLRTAWENDWGGIQEKVAAVIEFVRNIITTVMEGIRAFWTENGDAIMGKAQEIWTAIQTAIQTAITTVQTVITDIMTAIRAFWEEHGAAILASAQTVWDAIQGYIDLITANIKDLVDAFRSAFEGDWEAFGEKLRSIWDRGWDAIKAVVETIGPKIALFISNLVLDIIAFFQDTDWGQLGSDIIQGIADGVGAAVGFLTEAAKNVAQAAWDAITGFFGIHSPSRLMMGAGQNLVEGFSLGILDNLGLVDRAMDGLTARTVDPAQLTVGAQALTGPGPGGRGQAGRSDGQTIVKEYHLHLGTVADDTYIMDDFRLMEAIGRD